MSTGSFRKVVLPLILLLFPFVNSVHTHHKHGKIHLGIGAECRKLEGNNWHCGPGLWCGPNGVCEVEEANHPHHDEHLDREFTEDVFSVKQPFHEDSGHLHLDSVVSPQPPSIDELIHGNADKTFPKDQLPSSHDELFRLSTKSMFVKEHDSPQHWIKGPSDYKTTHLTDDQEYSSTNIMLEAMEYPAKRKHKKSIPIITSQHPLDDQELKSLMTVLPFIRYLYRDKFFSSTKSVKMYILSDGGSHETTVPSLKATNDVAPRSSSSTHGNSDSLSHDKNRNEHKTFDSDDSVHSTDYESVIDNPLIVDDTISSTEQHSIFEPTSTHETHFDLHKANLAIGSEFGVSSAPNLHSESDSSQSTTDPSTPQEVHKYLDDTVSYSETHVPIVDLGFSSEDSSPVKFISTSTNDLKHSSHDENPALSVRRKSSVGDSLKPDTGKPFAVDFTSFYDVTPTPSSNGQTTNEQFDPACSFEFIPLPFIENDKATSIQPFDNELESSVHLMVVNASSSDDGDNDDDSDVDHVQKNIVTVMNSTSVDHDPTSEFNSSMPSELFSKLLDMNSTEHDFNLNSTVTPAELSNISSVPQLPTPAPQINETSTFPSFPLKYKKPSLYSSDICSHVLMRLMNPLCYFRYFIS